VTSREQPDGGAETYVKHLKELIKIDSPAEFIPLAGPTNFNSMTDP
jgi:hypothetical protein